METLPLAAHDALGTALWNVIQFEFPIEDPFYCSYMYFSLPILKYCNIKSVIINVSGY